MTVIRKRTTKEKTFYPYYNIITGVSWHKIRDLLILKEGKDPFWYVIKWIET